MPDKVVRIDGMHCGGCEDRVTSTLSRLEGVREAEADHREGTATVSLVAGKEGDRSMREAVEELGYEVIAIEAP